MDLHTLIGYIGRGNKAAGWHDRFHATTGEDRRDHVITKLMLVNSELVEAVEELRDGHEFDHKYYRADGKPEGFGVEIADAVIRLLDLAHMLEVPLEDLIVEKIQYNAERGRMHGGKAV